MNKLIKVLAVIMTASTLTLGSQDSCLVPQIPEILLLGGLSKRNMTMAPIH